MEKNDNLEKLNFLLKWFQSKEKTERKRKLIMDLITDLKHASPIYEDFFSNEKVHVVTSFGLFSARLRPVTYKILLDFFNGLSKIPFTKDDLKLKEIDDLMNPLIHLFLEFTSSKEYLNHLIKMEITGDEVQKVNSMEIPHSIDAIRKHIKRINAFPIFPKDIAEVQKNLFRYKLQQFEHLTDNNLPNKTREQETEPEVIPSIEIGDVKLRKAEELKIRLSEYGFFEMDNIRILTNNQQDKLIFKLAENKAPYQIAMLKYIGFIEYLSSNYDKNKTDLYKIVATILDTYIRAISGNLNVLKIPPSDDLLKFTSHKFADQVKLDFQKTQN